MSLVASFHCESTGFALKKPTFAKAPNDQISSGNTHV